MTVASTSETSRHLRRSHGREGGDRAHGGQRYTHDRHKAEELTAPMEENVAPMTIATSDTSADNKAEEEMSAPMEENVAPMTVATSDTSAFNKAEEVTEAICTHYRRHSRHLRP
jgi:hypothetical protein